MEENKDQRFNDAEDESEEFELGHIDKLVGVFTAPAETFEKISNFPPKATDWFLPVLIFAVVAIFAQYVKMSNPTIYYDVMQKQKAAMEKNIDDAVKSGKMTREQADQQMEAAQAMMTNPIVQAIGAVVGIIIIFIIFFIMGGIYHLFAKFALKGSGTYGYTLVSYGLANYILVLQAILATIISLVFSRMVNDVSAASLMGLEKTSLPGFLLGFIDPISIWFYIAFGIGLAKTFRGKEVKNYIIMVFAVWIILYLLLFAAAQAVPFLSNFLR